MSHFPPDPRLYGSVERVPRQLRPARKPHERCPCLLTAVLLNKPDRLLLQDDLRLSGAAYTVGSEQRAATWGRPYGRAGNLTRGRTLCAPIKNEKRPGGLSVQKRNPSTPGGNPPYVAHFHTNTGNYGLLCPFPAFWHP